MITSLIGKTFLKAYNEAHNKNYTAKEFFEKEYFELFFNHPKYLMSGGNSPLENPKIKWGAMRTGSTPYETAEQRKTRLRKFVDKASNTNGVLNMGIAIGYPAADAKEFAKTSGQVTDLGIKEPEENIYYSWIGAGLGIGVGEYNILINDPIILLETYDGCKVYRKYLNDIVLNGKLLGNKINSWNGQWISYRFGHNYKENSKLRDLETQDFFKAEKNSTGITIKTVNWSYLYFSLSNLYPEKTLNAYIYSLGDTNKTLGFIPIYLKAGKRLKDVFRKLFHTDIPFNNKHFQSLFGMHIKRACELGNIGLHALQPDNLKKHMGDTKNITFKKEEDNLIYQSYKIWLVAMLSRNKEEITDYTEELAKLIQRYREGAKGTERKNLIEKDLLGASNKKVFIDALTTMIPDVEKEDLKTLKQLKDEVHLMTHEEFTYFNTLLKFDYTYAEKQS